MARIPAQSHKDLTEETDFDVRQGFEPHGYVRGRGGRGRGRSSRGRDKYQATRDDEFKKKQGAQTQEKFKTTVKKTLVTGLPTMEQLLLKIEENNAHVTVNMPITTRGIGLSLVYMYYTTATVKDLILPDIYAIYRVGLALVESKLQLARREYTLPQRTPELVYNYNQEAALSAVLREITVFPEPIKRIINALGVIRYEGVLYLPFLMRNSYTRTDQFIPRPENIVLSNLRQTVVALGDAATPIAYRRAFFENNSIPGAVVVNNVLINRDGN